MPVCPASRFLWYSRDPVRSNCTDKRAAHLRGGVVVYAERSGGDCWGRRAMTVGTLEQPVGGQERRAGVGAFAGLSLLLLATFLLTPWPLEEKSLAALHGLCAQRPSHSFWFAGSRLPFDARMTGIYGAFLLTIGYLAVAGRLRRAGLPRLPVLLFLAGGVVALGIDGVNALLQDLRLPTLYEPQNWLRFITGAWTGTLLGVVLWIAANAVIWRPGVNSLRAVLDGRRDLLALALLSAALGWLAMSGWRPLYWPLALYLVLAAVTLLALLALPAVQLLRRREQQIGSLAEIGWPATASLALACAFMVATSGLRFLVESVAGVPPFR
uniref:DUF2085 domain-containing protein n=1 Tax=Thermorudis sp. TaxID=1969470 RepID=A0A7C2WRK8_9BACT